jgi:hypothetical protein
MEGMISDPKAALAFMLAGKSTVTLVSQRTGARFTYRIKRVYPDAPLFAVKLLTGPNNDQDYRRFAKIMDGSLSLVTGSCAGEESPSYRAIRWVFEHLMQGAMPPLVEVWHEGRCGRCGRRLTVPESIGIGIGPDCLAQMMGRM